MDETDIERRKHKRIRARLPLSYKNLRDDNQQSKGVLIKDISEGGVRFMAEEFLSLANRLLVTINIPTTIRQIKAIAKIAWIKKMPLGEEYEIGNQFLEISREDRNEVAKYVSTILELEEAA